MPPRTVLPSGSVLATVPGGHSDGTGVALTSTSNPADFNLAFAVSIGWHFTSRMLARLPNAMSRLGAVNGTVVDLPAMPSRSVLATAVLTSGCVIRLDGCGLSGSASMPATASCLVIATIVAVQSWSVVPVLPATDLPTMPRTLEAVPPSHRLNVDWSPSGQRAASTAARA